MYILRRTETDAWIDKFDNLEDAVKAKERAEETDNKLGDIIYYDIISIQERR